MATKHYPNRAIFGNTNGRKNLVDQRFGRLIVRYIAGKNRWGNLLWYCDCDCGGHKIVASQLLLDGRTQSCGCLHREFCRTKLKQHNTTHGMKHSPEWGVWHSIKSRCYNPNWPGYKDYGGRGITMSDEWRKDFIVFYHDMGPRPEGKLPSGRALYSIERKNNDGPYCKDNCIWATMFDQQKNRRKSKPYTRRKRVSS